MRYEIEKISEKNYKNVDFSKLKNAGLVNNNGDGSVPYQTLFWLAYNDDGIIFQFECEDDCPKCTMTEYNEPIWEEETVEFFMATDNDLHNYLELEWNALNTTFCANIYNDLVGNTTIDYVKENIIESNVEQTKSGWIVKGFIPKELFKGEMTGEWRFNAYRIKRREDNSMILMAYSPTLVEAFHIPNMFGKLIFKK